MAIAFVTVFSTTIAMGTGSNAARNTTGVTLMCWYWPSSLPATQCSLVGLSNGVAAGSSRCKIATLTTGAIQTNGRCADANTNQTYASAAGTVGTTSFQHLVGVFDYTNKVMSHYYNGALVSTSAAIAGWTGTATSDTASLSFNIGSQHNAGSEYANGNIEDARVYNRVLSPAEIETIYNTRGADQITYGLKHRHLMREGPPSGSVPVGAGAVKDLAELQQNGTQANSPVYADGPCSELAILHAL